MANTKYSNILDTLEGSIVVGDAEAYFDKGKVLIAAANPDLMENYIEKHDLVILGNRYESQLCAIEMEAGCHHCLRGRGCFPDHPEAGPGTGLHGDHHAL